MLLNRLFFSAKLTQLGSVIVVLQQNIYMDTRIIKIAIGIASLAYTVYLFITGSIWGGIGMVFVTAIIGILVFRSLRMIAAFFYLRKQKIDKATNMMSKINPEKLWARQKGYYNFMMGNLELQGNKLSTAEKFMRRALKEGLQMDHDKAAATLNLAMISLAKQRPREAKIFIAEAKKLDKKGMMKNDIKQVEQMMKKPQNVVRQKHGRRY